jgi:hypothetical protein
MNVDDKYYIPSEIVSIVYGYLSLRDRTALRLVSKNMTETINGLYIRLRSGINTTNEQERILALLFADKNPITFLRAPPSTGKTMLSLWRILEETDFAARVTPLYIITSTSAASVWLRELGIVMPNTVIKSISFTGKRRWNMHLGMSKGASRSADVVLMSPAIAKSLFEGCDADAIEYLIFDEVHRSGSTEDCIRFITTRLTGMRKAILLSANNVSCLVSSERINTIEIDPSNLQGYLPDTRVHYHKNPAYLQYIPETYFINLCRGNAGPQHKIVVFLNHAPRAKRGEYVYKVVDGYKCYRTYEGLKRGDVIEIFNKSTESGILFLPYASCSTSFSINATDVVLFIGSDNMRSNSLYQARRRCLRLNSKNAKVDIHYVGATLSLARVGEFISEFCGSTKEKVSALYTKRLESKAYYDNLKKYNLNALTSSIGELLFILHPFESKTIMRSKWNRVPDSLKEKATEIRSSYKA